MSAEEKTTTLGEMKKKLFADFDENRRKMKKWEEFSGSPGGAQVEAAYRQSTALIATAIATIEIAEQGGTAPASVARPQFKLNAPN